jgi:hypothetical protein
MIPFSPYSPLNARRAVNGGKAQRRVAAAALCAGAVALITGCSASPTGSAESAGSTKPLTARAAITLAADETQRVTSVAATISAQLSGNLSETTSGTAQIQLQPDLLGDEQLNVSAEGQSYGMDEIVSTQAIYLKSTALEALTGHSHKPWIEIPLSSLSPNLGISISQLLQNVQNGNPMAQTRMLAAAANVRAVGTQVVDGVSTTHYTGSFTASSALAKLSPSQRAELSPVLKLVTGDIRFNVWIDGQHVARKLTETYTIFGDTMNVTMNVTAVNQPVHIALPRPRRVTVRPASSLGL